MANDSTSIDGSPTPKRVIGLSLVSGPWFDKVDDGRLLPLSLFQEA